MEYIYLIGKIISVILLCIIILCLFLHYSYIFICSHTKLKLYGYYTNGIYSWQLIQYDDKQVTLYDTKLDRIIVMGRNEFIRDFKFLLSDTMGV